MKNMKKPNPFVRSLSVATLGFMLTGTALAYYEIIDLGTLGGTESVAFGVNDSGEVVGYSFLATSGVMHAFLYSGGTMIDLGTLGGMRSGATDINNSGDVVGSSEATPGGLQHAFRYSAGVMTDISSAYSYGAASAINDSGKIVGTLLSGSAFRPFIYNNGSMQILGTFGGRSGEAYGINSSGQVVGQADTSDISGYTGYHAYLYSGGVMTDIHATPANQIFNTANDINDSGTVVGFHWGTSGSSSTPQLAFTYSGGVLMDIGVLPGGTDSVAKAINNNGDIVGRSKGVGFLYSNGTMTDLNSLLAPGSGWVIRDAQDINQYGQIVGYGSVNGEQHAYLLNPGC